VSSQGLQIYNTDEANRPLQRFVRLSGLVGLVGLILAAAAGALVGFHQFFQSYLFSYMFWLELSLGPLAIAMLHYLVGGRWGMALRRPLEAASRNILLMAVLFIPLALGTQHLYPWARPDVVAQDAILQHRTLFLNLPFFLIRAGIYFLVWTLLAYGLTRWARRPAYYADPEKRSRLGRLGAFGTILFGLTMSFAAVDWMKSTDPHWYSSIYPLLIITGQFLGGMAFGIALSPALAARTRLGWFITRNIYRDLGALLLSAVLIWAYIAFSQYLIIWSANIPHEVTWYLDRSGGWTWVLLFLLAGQFILPFMFLISLWAKRSPRILVTLSLIILFMRLVDYFWNIKPSFSPGVVSLHWMDILAVLAIGGLWLAAFAWNLARTPLVLPVNLEDPVDVRRRVEHPQAGS
jgi:hypothetical protein